MDDGLKEKILQLRKMGKTYNEIVNLLNCSKSVVSYHCKHNNLQNIGFTKEKISEVKIKEINDYYLTHTAKETAEYFNVSIPSITKYTTNKRVKLTNEEKKKRNILLVKKRRQFLKEKAVEYKGGCCEKCGYNKYIGALEFHHLDPNEKDFGIASNGITRSWEILKKELDQCILVCSNCHREIHGELYSGEA